MTNGNSTSKGFKKGELVVHISNWDEKGTFYYYFAVVYSCGKKQMVLTDAVSGVERGRHFAPVVATRESFLSHLFAGATFPRMSEEAAQALCLEAGAKFAAEQRAYYENILAKTQTESQAYRDAIRAKITEIHEPRWINWQKESK